MVNRGAGLSLLIQFFMLLTRSFLCCPQKSLTTMCRPSLNFCSMMSKNKNKISRISSIDHILHIGVLDSGLVINSLDLEYSEESKTGRRNINLIYTFKIT